MYSGFVTSRRSLAAIGVHQRFDAAAYRIASPYFAQGTFPFLRQILHFEGINGPDGLKVKSPGEHEPSHLYEPMAEVGELPDFIDDHYNLMVEALKKGDHVRAAFDAAWMAHYITDGLTPAHHFPLEDQLAKYSSKDPNPGSSFFKHKVVGPGDSPLEAVKRGWAIWGGKGLLTTHFNYEIGIAAALLGQKIKVSLDPVKLAQARTIGPVEFFKQEAKDIAGLKLYDKFYEFGWNGEMARLTKTRLAPQIVQTVAIIWLLAYLEAGLETAVSLDRPTEAKVNA
jgi:hypothetical protein